MAADLSEYLARLEELWARGEISEQTFLKLKDEYWKKLEQTIAKGRTQDRHAVDRRRFLAYAAVGVALAGCGLAGYELAKWQTPPISPLTSTSTVTRIVTQAQTLACSTLASDVFEEKAFVFTISDLTDGLHIEMTETVHTHGYLYDRVGWFIIYGRIANLQAFDVDGMKKLRTYLREEGGRTYFGAYLDPSKSVDFKVLLIFDRIRQGDISRSEGGWVLRWDWGTDEHPMPQSVKVKLPLGAKLVSVSVPSYRTSLEDGRAVVSFQGTAPPNGSFQWYVKYE